MAATAEQLQRAADLAKDREVLEGDIARARKEYEDAISKALKDYESRTAKAQKDIDRLNADIAKLVGATNGRTTARKPRAKRATGTGQRAKRGENKSKILALVADRPGISPGEVAQATGITQPVVYTTLNKMLKGGEVEQTDLGGGRKGYKVKK